MYAQFFFILFLPSASTLITISMSWAMILASRCRSSMSFPWRYWAKRFLGVMPNAERMPVSLVGLCERSSDVDVRLLTVCRNIFMLTMMLWYEHTAKLSISVDISKWNEMFLRDANEQPLWILGWTNARRFHPDCIVAGGLLSLSHDVQFKNVLNICADRWTLWNQPILKSRSVCGLNVRHPLRPVLKSLCWYTGVMSPLFENLP